MSKKILIVEDNELNMKLFRDLLEAHDFETITVRNGERVFEIVKDERPDLILMDIQLPEISGLDITKELKADDAFRDIPVIAVTAFADEEKIRESGCDAYIAKPISIVSLIQTVKACLVGDNKKEESGDT